MVHPYCNNNTGRKLDSNKNVNDSDRTAWPRDNNHKPKHTVSRSFKERLYDVLHKHNSSAVAKVTYIVTLYF